MPQRSLNGASRNEGSIPAVGDGPDPLPTLLDVGQVLSSQLEMRQALLRTLEYLERDRGVVRGAVMMLNDQSGEIRIDVSLGFAGEARYARYRLGEGIAGRVVESGQPIVVPAMSREPLLLHRAVPRRSDQTFICVPIAVDRRPVGALAVDLDDQKARDPEAAQRFFTVIASMIAQALKARKSIGESRRRLLEENRSLRLELQQRFGVAGIVGNSGAMRQAREQIARVAATDAPVLVRGEPGTGKELVAHAIHHGSPRARGPFVKARIGELPEGLVDSFLFGQEGPAGIASRKHGRVELAEGGTLFLDDVGHLGPLAQAKLLRALQQRELERPGGGEPFRTNVRIVAATATDLEDRVAAGTFRKDLYDWLAFSPILLPPLRDRRSDVLLLVHQFLARYAQQQGKNIRRISTPAVDLLVDWHWPGNVRELEDAIEHAVAACDGEAIHRHHLPPSMQIAEASDDVCRSSLASAVEQFEKDLIVDAIKSSRGNVAGAARLLNTTERIVGYKTRKYRIDPREYRAQGTPAGDRDGS